MRKTTLTLGAAAMLTLGLSAPAAQAQFQTGERLYADCTASLPDRQWQLKNAYCMAYVMGVVDALAEYEKVNEKMSSGRSKASFCPGPGFTSTRAREVTMAYLRDHEDLRQGPASGLVMAALIESAPCAKAGS